MASKVRTKSDLQEVHASGQRVTSRDLNLPPHNRSDLLRDRKSNTRAGLSHLIMIYGSSWRELPDRILSREHYSRLHKFCQFRFFSRADWCDKNDYQGHTRPEPMLRLPFTSPGPTRIIAIFNHSGLDLVMWRFWQRSQQAFQKKRTDNSYANDCKAKDESITMVHSSMNWSSRWWWCVSADSVIYTL